MVARSAGAGELAAWIHLSLVPGLGPANYRALLSAFGLPKHVLQAGFDDLVRTVPAGLARDIVGRSSRQAQVDDILEWAAQPGHHVITLADEAYPQRLLHLADPPPVLFLRGNPAWLSTPSIAVVGSRNATPGGIDNAERFSAALSAKGYTIVSGLALGIDAAAHRGGLSARGSTVAVMGTGIDMIYPKRNEVIARQIEEGGALVTEFPPGTAPLPGNFPRRNRIIAGLSRGVLVVEAALASGSLITARLAAEIGRDVFAIPGSIHSTVSKGCHSLIKQGAKLVESAEDVLEETASDRTAPATIDHHLSGPEAALLQHMGYDPCTIEVLCGRSGLTAETVSAMLLSLEIEGRVAAVSGGLYQRLP
jgi:DNA processing protein